MEISLDNRQTKIEFDTEDLKKKAERLLKDLGCSSSAVLSISLVDAREMAELNVRYRGKKGPTNVLSFSQHEGDLSGPHMDLLGDVVICADRVAHDADELGYTRAEMALYVLIHGVLHLMGIHHDLPDREKSMQEKVDELFHRLISGSLMP
ncbi:MAG: rRNA maturation RNase YbeY [Thermodesulfobacteriota bacterium]